MSVTTEAAGEPSSLKSGALHWMQVSALGIAIAISGNTAGWNYGLAIGGWGGMFMAALAMLLLFLGLTQTLAELSAALRGSPPHAPALKNILIRLQQILTGVRANRLRQAVQIVTAFENRNDPAAAMFIGSLHHQRGQVGEVRVSQPEMAQRIAQPRIETGRDENQIGLEFIHARRPPVAKRAQNPIAPGTRREGTIERASAPRAFARLVGGASARIPRPLVRAEEKHRWIAVKNLLRAVAVMDVPIHDRRSL